MIKFLVVIDTLYRGKKAIVELPLTEKVLSNLQSKYTHQQTIDHLKSYHSSEDLIKLIKENKSPNYNSNFNRGPTMPIGFSESNKQQPISLLEDTDLLLKLFTIENKKRGNFIFDIILQDYRFISFPIWIDINKYYTLKRKDEEGYNYDVKEEEVDNEYLNTAETEIININKEEVHKAINLKMFNIVLVYDKNSQMVNQNLKNIYSTLEAFSNYLLFEEYRNNYLGHEFLIIVKFYDKFFNNNFLINQKSDTNIVSSLEKGTSNLSINSLALDNFQKSLQLESGFFKTIKNIFRDFEKFNFIKCNINYWLEFRSLGSLSHSNISYIKPYHSLVLLSGKSNLQKDIFSSNDINLDFLLVLDSISPFKSLIDLSMELKLDILFIIKVAKNLINWKIAKLIFKIHNFSTFQVNPKFNIKQSNEKFFDHNFNYDLYKFLNVFSFSIPGNLGTIYQENFKSLFDNEKFLKIIIWLLENEYLIPCSIMILPKLPLKHQYNVERLILNKSQLLLVKKENLAVFLEDYDSNYRVRNSNDNFHQIKNQIYFEDFIFNLKSSNPSDFEIFQNIFYFFGNKYYIDEISYFTGYKIQSILTLIDKYDFLFNLINLPIKFEEDKA